MSTTKSYRAEGSFRDQHPVMVYEDEELLGMLRHNVHHSPDGHSWGYYGSGPSELAKDLLWDVLRKKPSPALYHKFKEDVIAKIPQNSGFWLTEGEVRAWLATVGRATYEGR